MNNAAGASSRWKFVISGCLVVVVAILTVIVFDAGSSTAPAGPLPVISGDAREGQTLHAALSEVSPRQARIRIKWVRCDARGAECRAIPQAQTLTYKLSAADVGSKIRF